jgi:peptidoglycan/LPS O-acetylase OafA/YrhL
MPFAHHYINAGKKIMLKKYYMRRVTRLEPPYILAITGIFLLQLLMHVNSDRFTMVQQWQHYFASLTYTHGLIYHSVPIITVVTWSLEIEIQFYLLAPLLFKVLQLPMLQRRALLLAGMAGIVTLQHFYMPQFLVFTIYRLIQYFMAGILLADFYVSGSMAALFNRRFIVPVFIALFAAICLLPFKESLALQLAFPLMICIFYYMIMKNDSIKRVFSYKFVPIIGGMCYSIYLLHYTIISIFGRFTMKFKLTDQYLPNLFLQLAILSFLALAISSIFYLLVERPFMDQKWTNKLMKKDVKHEETNMQS